MRYAAQGVPSDSQVLKHLVANAEGDKRVSRHQETRRQILPDEIVVDTGIVDYGERDDFKETKLEQVRPHRQAQPQEGHPNGEYHRKNPVKDPARLFQVEYQRREQK